MKKPRDLADRMAGREKLNNVIRETRRTSASEARKHAKRMFEDFPSSAYLTEIESWHVSAGGTFVEWTVKRLEKPVGEED